MTRFVVDSWVWIEYLNGTPEGLKLRELLGKSENEFLTSIISYAEIISYVERKGMDQSLAEEAISSNSEITNINVELLKKAGLFHAEIRKKIKDFGLGDAFVAITAKEFNAKILTGDPHFKNMKEAIMI